MSDLDRILKLAGHGTSRAQSQSSDREITPEAVGDTAEGVWALCDELDCSDHPVFNELVRYLDGDTLQDFVADFRRHNEMPENPEMESVDPEDEDENDDLFKDDEFTDMDDEDEEELKKHFNEEPNEGNAFSGAQVGKHKGEKFKVAGKEYTKEEDMVEGTWAVPETPEQIEKLKEIMSQPLPCGEDGDGAADVMYGILGDDELFDEFHQMSVDLGPDTDCRPAIQARLVELGLMDQPEAEEMTEASGVCEACGCQIDNPKPGCECTHDSHDAAGSHWVAEAISDEAKEKAQDRAKNYESPRGEKKKKVSVAKAPWDKEDLDEAQSPAQKAAFAKMLASKGGKKADDADEDESKDKEDLEESPTMDTTQLITLMKNSGLSEEKIKTKLDEWANTPDGAAEEAETSHGDPYEYAQSVNLSLKRYLDAEDMKVGLKEHTVDGIKEAYNKAKNK